MVSAVIIGASPESTMTWSYLLPESASRATMSACPVPRCSACSTKFTPVPATASRTRSASWPMITKISRAGTTFSAVAITWARIGLPPISCRTLGCFDLSRVPLPAAIMAMAICGTCGFCRGDFVFVSDDLAMLSQYTANNTPRMPRYPILAMESEASSPRPRYSGRARTPVATRSTPDRLPVGSLRHQRHQVMRHLVGRMPRHRALFQIISEDGTDAQRLDGVQIHHNLRCSFQRIFRLQFGRCRLAIEERVVKQRTASVAVEGSDMVGGG